MFGLYSRFLLEVTLGKQFIIILSFSSCCKKWLGWCTVRLQDVLDNYSLFSVLSTLLVGRNYQYPLKSSNEPPEVMLTSYRNSNPDDEPYIPCHWWCARCPVLSPHTPLQMHDSPSLGPQMCTQIGWPGRRPWQYQMQLRSPELHQGSGLSQELCKI